jgi:hypothetical protein
MASFSAISCGDFKVFIESRLHKVDDLQVKRVTNSGVKIYKIIDQRYFVVDDLERGESMVIAVFDKRGSIVWEGRIKKGILKYIYLDIDNKKNRKP